MPITDIKELRILPPFAIARFGSSHDPMDNYEVKINEQDITGFRDLVPAETLVVSRATGEITGVVTPGEVKFRDAEGRIKPVAPFFEVWARFDDRSVLEPLTVAHLADLHLTLDRMTWRVRAGNHKAFRRTGDLKDKIEADTGLFSDHAVQRLVGRSDRFKPGKSISLGSVQYLKPTEAFPEIRLRFTPAEGRVYGTLSGDPNIADDVYDGDAGMWDSYRDDPNSLLTTNPVDIFARGLDGLSLGYLDDSCDGIVETLVEINGKILDAYARFSVGPPDFAPDSFLVRTVADEIDQIIFGPDADEQIDTDAVIGLVRRALETMRLMNTEFLNRTFGRNTFLPSQAKYANALSRHSDVLNTVEGLRQPANTPQHANAVAILGFVLEMLRSYDQAANFTVEGRRLMPALMRGSDALLLAVTRRLRSKVEKASQAALQPQPLAAPPDTAEQDMINMVISLQANAIRHFRFDLGDGRRLSDLFSNPPALLQYLKTSVVRGALIPELKGKLLVVPGEPDSSAFVGILSKPAHPMHNPFLQSDPGTGKTRIDVVRDWIKSLA